MQCAFTSRDSKTEGYATVNIPAFTWAVFPSERFPWDKVVGVVDGLLKRYYSEWLPTTDYERAHEMNLEVYGGDDEMGYIELWFPVKKRI